LTSEDIPLLPAIPDRLRIAAKQGIVIPFIGAGVSQLGGCPGWDDFASGALHFFLQTGKLDHAQFDQLSRLPARVKLSLALGLEQQHGMKVDFRSLLQVRDPNKKKTGEKVYGHLAQLARIFVTTNYDDWLDTPYSVAPSLADEVIDPATVIPPSKRTMLFRVAQFTDAALSAPDTVFQIHGSSQDRDSMILTTSDYLGRYASHQMKDGKLIENPYLSFLGYLFLTKCVLFIGYSLSELEVLEYVIQKSIALKYLNPDPASLPLEEPQHHLIQGFFSHETALMRSLEDYYLREFNIRLLPFSKDQAGWSQLVAVAEHLAREIPVGGVLPSQQRLEMEALLK
jgi:hypothetical protein